MILVPKTEVAVRFLKLHSFAFSLGLPSSHSRQRRIFC